MLCYRYVTRVSHPCLVVCTKHKNQMTLYTALYVAGIKSLFTFSLPSTFLHSVSGLSAWMMTSVSVPGWRFRLVKFSIAHSVHDVLNLKFSLNGSKMRLICSMDPTCVWFAHRLLWARWVVRLLQWTRNAVQPTCSLEWMTWDRRLHLHKK